MALFWPEYALAMLDHYTTGLRSAGALSVGNRVGGGTRPSLYTCRKPYMHNGDNALTFPGLACYKLVDRPRLIALMPSLLGERENE